MKVGFIGAGNMAGAIIRGMIFNGFRGADILVYDTDATKMMALFEECGVSMCTSAGEVVANVQALVLAVKPQVLPAVLPAIQADYRRCTPLVISIAAGKTLASIEEILGTDLPLVRVMPNINAKVGEAISAFCGNACLNDEHRGTVRQIFEAVGEVIELNESLFSAFSVMASCSPAFSLLYMDTLAEAGVKYGIPKPLALRIAAQSVLGTARLLQETGTHPRVLIDEVCSPAGTTIAGLCALQAHGFEAAVLSATDASLARDKQL